MIYSSSPLTLSCKHTVYSDILKILIKTIIDYAVAEMEHSACEVFDPDYPPVWAKWGRSGWGGAFPPTYTILHKLLVSSELQRH